MLCFTASSSLFTSDDLCSIVARTSLLVPSCTTSSSLRSRVVSGCPGAGEAVQTFSPDLGGPRTGPSDQSETTAAAATEGEGEGQQHHPAPYEGGNRSW